MESPQPTKKKAPTISVASLPIGGNAGGDGGAGQCAEVNLIPPVPLPSGISVSMDSIALSPEGIFDFGGDQCGSTPPCTTSWTWTTPTSSSCTVAVTQVIDSSDSVTLVVAGTVTCPDQSTCDQVRSQFDGNGSQIEFTALSGVVPTESTSPSAGDTGGSTSVGNSSTSPTASPSASG